MNGATMSRRPKRVMRTMRTMTLSARSEALLERMSRVTCIPRGRIVDLALDLLEICDDCHGAGVVSGPMGLGTERCNGCAGERVRPVMAPKVSK